MEEDYREELDFHEAREWYEDVIDRASQRVRRAEYQSKNERSDLMDLIIECEMNYKILTGRYYRVHIHYGD